MTIAVDLGRKATKTKKHRQRSLFALSMHTVHLHYAKFLIKRVEINNFIINGNT